MMKRPRSFIATLLLILSLSAPLGIALVRPTDARASGTTTRLMNPRAGDPDEPGTGIAQPGGGGYSNEPSDPIEVVPVMSMLPGLSFLSEFDRAWTPLSHAFYVVRREGR